ncbi:hypothetical protein V1282_003520 [Nitrobacteraceae bacterium AZCC 2146]
MALSPAFIETHISKWENELTKPWYPYRNKWPSRLFHHAPIENAVELLKDGNLRSRADPANARQRDVAASAVIAARDHAHNFARLYFRPRTPTQWHIEGIRKQGDFSFGANSHAPVLTMFVFDARKVLISDGVKFCDRNMQLGSADPNDSETYFSTIPFEKVFHVGNIGGDRTIIEHRCAEVLAESPLPLSKTLQWIYCRTAAERDTLCDMLGDQAATWSKKIIISDDLLVFERKYVFVEYVGITDAGLIFELNPREDSKPVSVKITATDDNGNEVINFTNKEMAAHPSPTSKRWRISAVLPHGNYRVQIELEGHLAFRANVRRGDQLV